MNDRVFREALRISKAMQGLRKTGQSFHTSFAIKKNKIICVGWNCYKSPHNECRFGKYYNRKFTSDYEPNRHSECHLCEKLDESKLKDYEILNVRINKNGEPRLSQPCHNCFSNVVLRMMPKKFFYSDNNNSYQELKFK